MVWSPYRTRVSIFFSDLLKKRTYTLLLQDKWSEELLEQYNSTQKVKRFKEIKFSGTVYDSCWELDMGKGNPKKKIPRYTLVEMVVWESFFKKWERCPKQIPDGYNGKIIIKLIRIDDKRWDILSIEKFEQAQTI